MIILAVDAYLCRNWNDFFFEFTGCCCSCSTLVRLNLILQTKSSSILIIFSYIFWICLDKLPYKHLR